jgi:hypothetical protein
MREVQAEGDYATNYRGNCDTGIARGSSKASLNSSSRVLAVAVEYYRGIGLALNESKRD